MSILAVLTGSLRPTSSAAEGLEPGARRVMAVLCVLLLAFLFIGALIEADGLELGRTSLFELLWLLALELWTALRSPVGPTDAVLLAMSQGLVALYAGVVGLFLLVPLQIVWALVAVVYDWFQPIDDWRVAPPLLVLGLTFLVARGLMELFVDRAQLRRSVLNSDDQ